jgi:hypothetical protein
MALRRLPQRNTSGADDVSDPICPYEERVELRTASDDELRQIVELLLKQLDLIAVAETTPDYRSIRLAKGAS